MSAWGRNACRLGVAAAGGGFAASFATPAHADGQVVRSPHHPIPVLGFGTANLGDRCTSAVVHALAVGYRHIDTALLYGTHPGVAQGLKDTTVARDDIFLTTKLGFFYPGPAGIISPPDGLKFQEENSKGKEKEGMALALKELGVDYVNLTLVHTPCTSLLQMWTAYIPHYHGLRGWPKALTSFVQLILGFAVYLFEDPAKARAIRKANWQAMEELVREGKTRAIGVSNYEIKHIEELMEYATIKPVVNQFECHPNFPRTELVDYCNKNGIASVGYGTDKAVSEMRKLSPEERDFTSASLLGLRWTVEHGVIVIPRSGTPLHIEENSRIFGWSLNEAQKAAIKKACTRDEACFWDPPSVP